MPTMPCQYRLTCEDSLLTNYTSEGAEPFPPYYAVVYPPLNPPPLDQDWSMAGCLYLCRSFISQEDANLCALRQAVLCNEEEIWYSAPATCTATCPDGTIFYYTVAAGMFVAKTYEEALAQAQAYACAKAQEERICIADLPRCACYGQQYSAAVGLTVPNAGVVFSIVGSLPPGLQFISNVITGIPTVNGTYAFNVIATDTNGNYAIRTFTIQVVQITTTALPDFTVGTPYSFQLTAAGGSGNYTWSVATGTLPDGLDLSMTGLISGTPTALATGDTLTFEVRDATCEAAQRIALTPRALLRSVSSTTVKTYRGFVEYTSGGVQTGQLYKRVDYIGSLTQVAFPNFNADPAVNATQCGGLQYIYSGYDQIDNNGNVTSRHRKDMMVMCAASQPSLFETEVAFGGAATLTPIYSPPKLYGYCWPTDPDSCPACDTSDTTWNLLRDDAWFGAIDYPTDMVWDIANVTFAPTTLTYAGNAALSGGVTLDPSIQGFPKNNGGLYTTSFPFVRLTSSGGFSATLSEPFTDSDANATAVVYTGTLASAENMPNYQITGSNNFITRRNRVTSVAFSILCTNLIAGTAYNVTYELVSSNGSGMSVSVDFTATDTTYEVTGTVPTPAANVKTTIRNARIQYA